MDEVCLVSFLAENAQMGTLSSVSVYVEVLILYENGYSFCSVFDLLFSVVWPRVGSGAV